MGTGIISRVSAVFRDAFARLFPVAAKRRGEMDHWIRRKAIEGTLGNQHYTWFYTEHFGLDLVFYQGKRILDIGCGPRGSLEWADGAAERVGLDPLAQRYLKLGADKHKMRYVEGTSESIPFPDAHFDVVCSFNSFDHVEDLQKTIAEIKRVTRPGGLFLLLVEVGHDPTQMEPHDLPWDCPKWFEPQFQVVQARHYEKSGAGMYDSILIGTPYDHTNPARRYGILSAKLERVST